MNETIDTSAMVDGVVPSNYSNYGPVVTGVINMIMLVGMWM